MPKKSSPEVDAVANVANDTAIFRTVISTLEAGLKLDASLDGAREIRVICERELALLQRSRKEAAAKLEF